MIPFKHPNGGDCEHACCLKIEHLSVKFGGEAALDDVNVARYAQYLRRMTDRTQFIVITHRRGTMEAADVLYGVTMQERGVSKVLTINMNDMAKELNIKE